MIKPNTDVLKLIVNLRDGEITDKPTDIQLARYATVLVVGSRKKRII